MKNNTTEQKIKQLNENGIQFRRYRQYLVIYNYQNEELITENLLKVNIQIIGEKITLNSGDIKYLFDKFNVYIPLTLADYNVAIENDKLLKNMLGIQGTIGEEIYEDKALEKALNYYINNKYNGDVLYYTLKIYNQYEEMMNDGIIGFHFPKGLISEVCEELNIPKLSQDMFNGGHAIPHEIFKEEHRNILLTRSMEDESQLNGVIYSPDNTKSLYEIIELGKLYDKIYYNNRVLFGYKFNPQPNETELNNYNKILGVQRLSKCDKQTYNFQPRRM